MKSDLLKHLQGESIGRFPVWAMRQAGRYLSEYRAIRSKHSFWEMVSIPEVAAEVSLTPLTAKMPVDGIIFFSDILTMPYGLGLPVEMREGVGPVMTKPMRATSDFEVFHSYDSAKHTPYVGSALRIVREKTPAEIALLGFAGAPWTVASYLAEGTSGRKFASIRSWMHRDPASLAEALEALAGATVLYLTSQVEAGAEVVQVFDTWLSEMPRTFFLKYYAPLLNRIFRGVKKSRVPVIYFAKHAHHLIEDFQELEMDILSCDELLTLTECERKTGSKFMLQGNLDPFLLFSDPALVRLQTRKMVSEARALSRPAIMNLGHGIMPGTPVESVRAFFEEARTLWV
jgi:uroporphyrinogen decarboxylase